MRPSGDEVLEPLDLVRSVDDDAPDAKAQEKIAGLQAKYQDGDVYTMDGVSAEFPDWHFNVRGSNTEPMLRLNLEALTPELMAQKRDEVLAFIRS